MPLTYLNAALRAGGVWNAARYSNKKFDKMVASFEAAPSLAQQKKYARQMQFAAAQGHAGHLRVLLQLHRRHVPEGARATCPTASLWSTCAGVTIG